MVLAPAPIARILEEAPHRGTGASRHWKRQGCRGLLGDLDCATAQQFGLDPQQVHTVLVNFLFDDR
jgi:hypothetical protein